MANEEDTVGDEEQINGESGVTTWHEEEEDGEEEQVEEDDDEDDEDEDDDDDGNECDEGIGGKETRVGGCTRRGDFWDIPSKYFVSEWL